MMDDEKRGIVWNIWFMIEWKLWLKFEVVLGRINNALACCVIFVQLH